MFFLNSFPVMQEYYKKTIYAQMSANGNFLSTNEYLKTNYNI